MWELFVKKTWFFILKHYKTYVQISLNHLYLNKIKMRETICSVCWKHFLSNTSWKYCSDECRRKAFNKKSAEYQKAKRSRIQICVDCWKEYPTRRWQTKYCEECRRRHYTCPVCWWIKENIKQRTCKKCSTTARVCPICWRTFIAKWVKTICSRECRLKQKRDYYLNKRKLKTLTCNKCWKKFTSRDWLWHQLCKHCCENKNICSNCWWYKKSSAEHCHHCSELSRTYVCEKCWKKCIWVKQTKYCDDCYPKCKLCWKKCDNIYEECCSRSCAMKLKRTREESAKKMIANIKDMNNWKYNKWNKSSVNDLWKKLFENEWFNVEQEFMLKNDKWLSWIWTYCLYDFKIWNTLIEINPTISHNSTIPYRKWWKPKPEDYHRNKSILWSKNWYRVISIYDWDINDEFKNRLIVQLKEKEILTDVYTRAVNNDKVIEFLKWNIYVKYKSEYWASFYEWIFYKWKLIWLVWFEAREWFDNKPFRYMWNIYIKQWYDIDSETMKVIFTKIFTKRRIDYIVSAYNVSKWNSHYIEEMWFYISFEDIYTYCINTKTWEEDGDWYERDETKQKRILKEWYVEVCTEWENEIIWWW